MISRKKPRRSEQHRGFPEEKIAGGEASTTQYSELHFSFVTAYSGTVRLGPVFLLDYLL